jgi:hypothetical protein
MEQLTEIVASRQVGEVVNCENWARVSWLLLERWTTVRLRFEEELYTWLEKE